MLHALLYPLKDFFFGFNVLKYITFRAAMAAIFAFLMSVLLGPWFIGRLKAFNASHSHHRAGFDQITANSAHKTAVPTMGGILITGTVLLACLLWGDLGSRYLRISMFGILALSFIGFGDDLLKLKRGNAKGLLALTKFSGEMALGLIVGFYLYLDPGGWAQVHVPFVKDWALPLGVFYVVFVCLVLVGTSNAVNLTDGLDGLAIGCTVFIALTYSVFSYLAGHSVFAGYLYLPYVEGAGELTVFCASIVGAGLGFLWFNSHPASVFMGDTGSLSLGGGIGIVAVLIKQELLLLVVGGVFVMEAMSVILQVAGYKLTGKRLFRMAPIHHHFQLKGWNETKVVVRFWIITVILCLAGLASIKLR